MNECLISSSFSSQLHPLSHKLIVAKVIMYFSTNTRHIANYKLNGNLIKTSYGDPQWELWVWKKNSSTPAWITKINLVYQHDTEKKSKLNIICLMFSF